MAVKEVGRFVNVIQWKSDNSWQKEMQRIKKYKKTVESAQEQVARSQYRAQAGMLKAEQAQARAREKVRKAAIAAQMRSQKQLQALEKRQAKEQARHNKLMSGVISGRSMAKQRTITTMSGMRNMFSTATFNKYRASLQSLNAQYAAGGMSLSMYNQKLAALRNEMRATEASARRMGATLKSATTALKSAGMKISAGIDRAFTGAMMGTAAAGGLTKVAMDNSANRNSAYYGLMAMNNDDKAKTDDQMRFIRNISNAHGMDQKTAETGYMQWAASTKAMTENDRRALFEAMAIKGRSTGATGEQLQRAQVALSQMASKSGVVSSEELKGQLSEALAGSQVDFQEAYAKSIGKTSVSMEDFNKAMKDGNVNLMKLLPHLVEIWNSAKNTRAYAESMKQPEMAMQRLKNAAYDASVAMFGQIDATDGVYTLAEMVDDAAQHLTQTLQENKKEIEGVGAGIAAFFARIQYGLGWFYEACKPILEFFGVNTNNAKEVGDFLGKAVLFFGALKAVKSVVGLLEPFATGFIKLIKAIVKGAEYLGIEIPKPGKNKGPGNPGNNNTTKTVSDALKGAGGASVAANAAASAVGVGVGVAGAVGAKEVGERFRDWMQDKADRFGKWAKSVGLLNDEQDALTKPGAYKHDYINKGTSFDPYATPTVNTAQALPVPATGFNGAVPSQVMVESSGDINAQFQVTVDENGLLRVVQKEVETAIGWEKTKEINMFAVGV